MKKENKEYVRFEPKQNLEQRTQEIGRFIVETGSTVRAAGDKFDLSKSTIHLDVNERLQKINPQLWLKVRAVLDNNKAERHIRGGMATKLARQKNKL